MFILDEVQSNFGRTGDLFAFETYGLEPDLVVLGQRTGQRRARGRRRRAGSDCSPALDYGEGSDTWSANPLCCAAVLATLDEFAAATCLAKARRLGRSSKRAWCDSRSCRLSPTSAAKKAAWSGASRCAITPARSAADWANAVVLACYRGDGNLGIHLLGPLAKKVLRIAPPLVISERKASSMDLMCSRLAGGPFSVRSERLVESR